MRLPGAFAVCTFLLSGSVAAAGPPPPRALRVIYAPFYVAGLSIRYGLYYGIAVPLEVFGRALAYGFEGGVDGSEGSKDGQR